jgi:uncharacterized protein involved in type VI secretion and phage assembly
MMDGFYDARVPTGLGGRFYGVYPATVHDIRDPQDLGRVKVRLPWADDGGDQPYEAWARLATLMAGADRGSWFIPDEGDEVLVAFAGGDPRQPFVVGALWNGKDAPPARMDGDGKNHKKVLRTRSGLQITLDDQDGHESLVIETPGKQVITLKDGPGEIELRDSSGNTIHLESGGVTVQSSGQVKVSAASVEVSASTVTVNAGISKFSGVVQCDTLITNSVVSASYTPGAGNLW